MSAREREKTHEVFAEPAAERAIRIGRLNPLQIGRITVVKAWVLKRSSGKGNNRPKNENPAVSSGGFGEAPVIKHGRMPRQTWMYTVEASATRPNTVFTVFPSKRVKRTVIRRREIPMRADVFIDKTEGEG